MRITMPQCFVYTKKDKRYNPDSYSKRSTEGSIYDRELIGYKTLKSNDKNSSEILETLEIAGEKFPISSKFVDLKDEIIDSLYILELKEGWGENGAAIKDGAYKCAIGFLIKYFEYIHTHSSIVISTPEINPVRNGSIDLVWNTTNGYMLVNIAKKKDALQGTFFGFKKTNKKIKEGEIDIQNVEPPMALWMTTLT